MLRTQVQKPYARCIRPSSRNVLFIHVVVFILHVIKHKLLHELKNQYLNKEKPLQAVSARKQQDNIIKEYYLYATNLITPPIYLTASIITPLLSGNPGNVFVSSLSQTSWPDMTFNRTCQGFGIYPECW